MNLTNYKTLSFVLLIIILIAIPLSFFLGKRFGEDMISNNIVEEINSDSKYLQKFELIDFQNTQDIINYFKDLDDYFKEIDSELPSPVDPFL